jgi:hypothetical protein
MLCELSLEVAEQVEWLISKTVNSIPFGLQHKRILEKTIRSRTSERSACRNLDFLWNMLSDIATYPHYIYVNFY